jgi:hypothetical protein
VLVVGEHLVHRKAGLKASRIVSPVRLQSRAVEREITKEEEERTCAPV